MRPGSNTISFHKEIPDELIGHFTTSNKISGGVIVANYRG